MEVKKSFRFYKSFIKFMNICLALIIGAGAKRTILFNMVRLRKQKFMCQKMTASIRTKLLHTYSFRFLFNLWISSLYRRR